MRELEQRKAALVAQQESSRPKSLKVSPLILTLGVWSLYWFVVSTPVRVTTRKTGEGFIARIRFASADEYASITTEIGFNTEEF